MPVLLSELNQHAACEAPSSQKPNAGIRCTNKIGCEQTTFDMINWIIRVWPRIPPTGACLLRRLVQLMLKGGTQRSVRVRSRFYCRLVNRVRRCAMILFISSYRENRGQARLATSTDHRFYVTTGFMADTGDHIFICLDSCTQAVVSVHKGASLSAMTVGAWL